MLFFTKVYSQCLFQNAQFFRTANIHARGEKMLNKLDYKSLIQTALKEDLHDIGDVTSTAVFSDSQESSFTLYAKEDGVLCGSEIFTAVFNEIDSSILVNFLVQDGAKITKDNEIAKIQGKIRGILTAERTAINFLSQLSAVSTKAAYFVSIAQETANKCGSKPIIILDTRKTLPGMRNLQKYAVRIGGAQNHRIGLFDMVLLKDNHIDAAGGITKAVQMVRNTWGSLYAIEVETRTLDDVREALSLGVERIMLDNMDNQTMSQAVKIIDEKCEIEASGNMSVDRLKELAGSGITHISFGELTHTVKAFDFSLRAD